MRVIRGGQQAIELSEAGHGPDIIEPLPVRCGSAVGQCADLSAHPPGHGGGELGHDRQEFRYLPPTAASLALLQVPVPPSPRLPGALAHPKQRLTGPMFHRSGYKRPYVPSGRSNSGVQSSSSTVRMIRRSREASWFFSRSDRRPRRWQFREYAYHL